MTTIGFSAFLRLVSLNLRPQRREIGKRLIPSSGGYDFHRSLRHHVARLVEGDVLADVMTSAGQITSSAERQSAESGILKFDAWRAAHAVAPSNHDAATLQGPSGLFRVRFEPDFDVVLGGQRVAVHLWNTKHPELDVAMARVALSLVREAYSSHDGGPDDVAVLSLHEPMLIRLADGVDYSAASAMLIGHLEDVCVSIMDEFDLPPSGPPQPHP